MTQARPPHGELTKRGMAALDRSAIAAKGWQGAHRSARCKAAATSWRDPEQRERRRTAITRAMRDPATRSTMSNSRRLANALNDLDMLKGLRFRSRGALAGNLAQAAQEAFALASYEAALGAAASAFGLTLRQARRGNAATAAGKARAIASYLAVHLFGAPSRPLALARGVDRRGLRRVIADVERHRDSDAAFDVMVTAIARSLA